MDVRLKSFNNDDYPEYKQRYLGKEILIKEDFFIARYRDDIVAEPIVEVCGGVSGKTIILTKKQYLKNPKEVYVYDKNKVIGIGKGGTAFRIAHAMYYRKNTSDNFG